MLRLHVSCGLIPPAKTSNIGKNYKSSVLQFPGVRWVCAKALREEANGGGSGFVGRNWDPGLEVEVPFEQRPVNEYSSLKDGPLYSWGELSPGPFFLRIGGLWLVTFTVLGIPIAAASFNPSREPLRFLLAAGTGTLFLVALVVLRIYLGWSYVGDRLLSAVIPYEETGWYDGQMWVKPPEVLARDRLLGSYKIMIVGKASHQVAEANTSRHRRVACYSCFTVHICFTGGKYLSKHFLKCSKFYKQCKVQHKVHDYI
ncbi:hypothetical protein AQUCO_04200106v1 [Aquilegia coerulea]|uniref:Uncharacterized protein n=1 Tax=Aquilegia coerulea TaxID=218851 RepID=A0A2G5CP99_AQUCA|nr:hypothetical protein AQUCO_04200106v1 [Aquilegia coerulea]